MFTIFVLAMFYPDAWAAFPGWLAILLIIQAIIGIVASALKAASGGY